MNEYLSPHNNYQSLNSPLLFLNNEVDDYVVLLNKMRRYLCLVSELIPNQLPKNNRSIQIGELTVTLDRKTLWVITCWLAFSECVHG
jgi:hypothetical protein